MPIGSMPDNDNELLALPLLIDLGFGAEEQNREAWTFPGSAMFNHAQVVNWWPEPEILDSVLANFNHGSLFNPNVGKLMPRGATLMAAKPDQQKMDKVVPINP